MTFADKLAALREAATPGPWEYEQGGGHARNRIVGSESVQISGWRDRINGIGNASYTDMVCENLGDLDLDAPKANVELIGHLVNHAADIEALVRAAQGMNEIMGPCDHIDGDGNCQAHFVEANCTAKALRQALAALEGK